MIDETDVGFLLDQLRPYLAGHASDIVTRAIRSGSVPALQPATVVDADVTSGVVMVRPDGDGTVDVPAATLVGIPAPGSRVMLLYQPPAGVFVVGYIGPMRRPRPVGGRWQRAAGQPIATTTVSVLVFDSVWFDTDRFIGPMPGGNFTVPIGFAGRYLFTGQAAVTGGTTARCFVQLAAYTSPAGTLFVRQDWDGGIGEDRAGVSGMFTLDEGDTVQMQVFQASFSTFTMTGYLEAFRLGD